MRISDWSSDVCSSDLPGVVAGAAIGPSQSLVQPGREQRRLAVALIEAACGGIEDVAQARVLLVPGGRVAANAGTEQILVEKTVGSSGDRRLPLRFVASHTDAIDRKSVV